MLDPADAQHRAIELWRNRHDLTPDQRAEVASMPDPYRSAFDASELRRCGRRSEALLIASAALPTTVDPSPFRAHLLRLQAAVLADLRLVDQAVEANHAAQDVAKALGDDGTYAACLQDLATYPHQPTDRIDALLGEARAIAQAAGEDDVVLIVDFNRAWWRLDRGVPIDELHEAFADVEERSRPVWPDLADEALACRVMGSARAGDLTTARVLAERLPSPDGILDEETRTRVACAHAWVLADEGLVEEAQQMLERWREHGSEDRHVDLLTALSEVLAHAGRYAAAWRASQDLVAVTRDTADSLGTAQARALEVWYRTRLAAEASDREQARTEELEAALARLSEAHEQIRELSQRDALTGLHHRAHLLDAGAAAVATAAPGAPAQIALVDVDRFRGLNATYGNAAGDAILVRVARLLTDAMSGDDVVARYAGAQFVVVRPIGVRPTRPLATDIAAVAAHLRSLAVDAGPSEVTLSIGVVDAVGGTFEGALHLAELRADEARRAGGDRIVGA